MFQSPATQLQLAREVERDHQAELLKMQAEPNETESVLDSLVRRLKQLMSTQPLQPLRSEAS